MGRQGGLVFFLIAIITRMEGLGLFFLVAINTIGGEIYLLVFFFHNYNNVRLGFFFLADINKVGGEIYLLIFFLLP